MTDFERRVQQELRAASELVDVHTDLAAGARTRTRRRRAGWTASVVAAMAVAAVPVGVTLATGGDALPRPPATQTPTPQETGTPVPDGVRAESWRDVQVLVPDDWGYGNLSTWCLDGGEPGTPVVDRPGDVVALIDCGTPERGYGVAFNHAATADVSHPSGHVWQYRAEDGGPIAYPDGAWVSIWHDGDVSVTVVTPSESLAKRTVDSIERFNEADANGCPPHGSMREHAGGVLPEGVQVSVCRYTPDGWLEQSELLSPEQSDRARAALEQAPRIVDGSSDCAPDDPRRQGAPRPFVLFRAGGLANLVDYAVQCPGDGLLMVGSDRRELTQEVMDWALSPGWSGSVARGVPLPDRGRR